MSELGPLAVLLSRFPSVSETFILREVVELDRAGVDVVFVPLLREPPPAAKHARSKLGTGARSTRRS